MTRWKIMPGRLAATVPRRSSASSHGPVRPLDAALASIRPTMKRRRPSAAVDRPTVTSHIRVTPSPRTSGRNRRAPAARAAGSHPRNRSSPTPLTVNKRSMEAPCRSVGSWASSVAAAALMARMKPSPSMTIRACGAPSSARMARSPENGASTCGSEWHDPVLFYAVDTHGSVQPAPRRPPYGSQSPMSLGRMLRARICLRQYLWMSLHQ